MGYSIHEHKRYYYTFDNSCYLLSIQNASANLSALNHNVGFFRVSTRALA